MEIDVSAAQKRDPVSVGVILRCIFSFQRAGSVRRGLFPVVDTHASASYDLETLDAISSPQETSNRLCGSDVTRLPAC